jgi:hypothetical protein
MVVSSVVLDVERDGASGDLFIGRGGVAEFADTDHVFILKESRAEGAAGERAVGVQFAESGSRVEHGTRVVIALFALGAFPNESGARGRELRETFQKARDIASADWKSPMTALGATGTAGEPGAALASGFG